MLIKPDEEPRSDETVQSSGASMSRQCMIEKARQRGPRGPAMQCNGLLSARVAITRAIGDHDDDPYDSPAR